MAQRRPHRSTRRTFLRGAAGFTLTVPFLPSLFRVADAGLAEPSRRLVSFLSLNGQRDHFWPTEIPRTPDRRIDTNVHAYDLSEIVGPVSPVLGEAFDPFRSKLAVLSGLDSLGMPDHNRIFPLTGAGYGGGDNDAPQVANSIDVVLARSNKFYPTPVSEPVLRLQPASDQAADWDRNSSTSVRDGVQLPGDSSAEVVFNRLFAAPNPNPPVPGVDPRERQILVIDRVKQDYDRLRGSGKLSGDDRVRLDQFVDYMRDLQTRLAIDPIDCDGPMPVGEATVEELYTNHIDMMVAALACGMTKIATMMCYQSGSALPGSNPHGNSHETTDAAIANDLVYNTWTAARVLEIIAKLDAFVEPDGNTLLDNSLFMWSNEISEGKSHDMFGMPTLIAGGCGGKFRTGVHVNFQSVPQRDWASQSVWLGRPYNQLLTSIMAAMGLSREDWEEPGQPGFGTYAYLGHEYASGGGWDEYIGAERDYLPYYYVG